MGTSGRDLAPWQDYGDAVVGKDSAELDKAVEEYAKHRHEGPSSAQNLEELARWQEENYNAVSEYRFLDPKDYADIEPRIGRKFTYEQFINKLRHECKLKCFYREMGHPQKLALWAFKSTGGEPEVACWCQRPVMIEYEVVRFDDKGLPVDSRFRGWRTCLLDLRRKGFLSEEKIKKAFGEATGPASSKYKQIMQSLRKFF